MAALLFSSLDDEGAAPLSLSNRAFSYGDGIFETLRVVSGEIPLLDYNRSRFLRGAEVLQLGAAAELLERFDEMVRGAITQLSSLDRSDSVLKLFAVRKAGGRGYAPAKPCVVEFYLQAFELPTYDRASYDKGIDLQLCRHRLSLQPSLSGVKHLNRLDQVLGASELTDAPEGLMLDQHGHVIEGTKSNLLIFSAGQILTPRLTTSGIQGTLLSALLAGELPGVSVEECSQVTIEQLKNAESLCMVNSVFGVWPVKHFDGTNYRLTRPLKKLQKQISERFSF